MLSPWQRMIEQRQQQQRVIRNMQAFQQAARAMAREIVEPPLTPAQQAIYDDYSHFDDIEELYHPRDPDLDGDQSFWSAEREIEAWNDFVKEIKHKK